jgi:hypothetical protein
MAHATEEKLSRKQESALIALLEKGTVREAAGACGTSETTIWRWLRESPEFHKRYHCARLQLVDTAIARLQSASEVAINTLREICENTEAPATARIAAARAILSGALRGLEMNQNTGQNLPEHTHLCGTCQKQFACTDKTDEEFMFAICPVCKVNPNQPDKMEM